MLSMYMAAYHLQYMDNCSCAKVIALSSALQIIKGSETIALLIVADTEWTSSSDSGLTLP